MVNGVKLYAFLETISEIMAEAIAEDDPAEGTRPETYEPGGALHVPAKRASDRTRDTRWNRWVPFIGRASRALGAKDHSWLMGKGVGHALMPRGHGDDVRRRLGLEPGAFLAALLEDEAVRARIKKAIADVERTDDHVKQCVLRKRQCHATYDMIDAYRSLFLIKHPSRGAMVAETKNLISHLYSHVMSAGDKWATGEEVEAARLRAAEGARAEAQAATTKKKAWADVPWNAFSMQVKNAAVTEARARGKKGSAWMSIAKEWWAVSPANPAVTRQAADADMDMGDAPAAAPAPAPAPMPTPAPMPSASTPVPMEETAAGRAEILARYAAESAEDVSMEDAAAAENNAQTDVMQDVEQSADAEDSATETEARCSPSDESAREHWLLGGYLGVEVKKEAKGKTAQVPGTPTTPRRVAFIMELLKTNGHSTAQHGRFGICAFYELLRQCEERDVHEVHLIVRLFENRAALREQTRWERTKRAIALYDSLGFEPRASHHANIGYTEEKDLQQYMVVKTETLREKIMALAEEQPAELQGGATWEAFDKCRLTARDRRWYEVAAIDAIAHEHDAANGGDGAIPKTLVPAGHEKFSLYCCVPKNPSRQPLNEAEAEQLAHDVADAEDSGETFDFEFELREDACGEVHREYADTRQECPDNVEQETACAQAEAVEPSWGASAAFEVLQYLLQERVRGCVILPGNKSQYFGYKMSLDAAVVRRAKRGRKKWTTIILQILCSGVQEKTWGRSAVVNMLQDAHSPNKFAKVRVWNGADDRVNFEAHVNDLIKQLLELQEKGLAVSELVAPLPPCIITMGEDGELKDVPAAMQTKVNDRGNEATIGMQWHGGASDWQSQLRESNRDVLVTDVKMQPNLCICLDGGTWSAAAGVRVCAERPSLFTSWTKEEFAKPLEWVWLEQGDTVRAYCERHAKGDEGYLALALWAQQWRTHGAGKLSELTRPSERVPLTCVSDERDERDGAAAPADAPPPHDAPFQQTERQLQAHAQHTAQVAWDATQGARGEAVTTWACCRLRRLSPRFGQSAWLKRYESPVDGVRLVDVSTDSEGCQGRYGIEIGVKEATLVRMPVVPEPIGSRPLPKAVWKDMPVMSFACLCVLHGAMCTGENLLTRLLAVRAATAMPRAACPGAHSLRSYRPAPCSQDLCEVLPHDGEVESAVKTHLNPTLEEIGIGAIRKNPDTDKCYAFSLDGSTVERFIQNLEQEESIQGSSFLQAVERTFQELGPSKAGDLARFKERLGVLRHWRQGFRLALRYKPLEGDYAAVKRELALYFGAKMLTWPESNTWYDNECLYIIGYMHERWGSLRLVSQEGMEAWQKKLNEVLRLGNGFANAGAIPLTVIQAGEAAKCAYMAKRAEDKPSSAKWIYEQAMLQQHAYMNDTIVDMNDLEEQGKKISWMRYVTYWRRYMVCAAMRCRLRARVLRRATRLDAQGASVRRAPDGLYATLLKEHRDYWADVDMYLSATDLDANELRKQRRRLRQKRYRGDDLFKGCARK